MFSRNQKALAFVTGALLSLQSFAADLTEVSFTALSAEELQAVLTFDGEAPAASGYLMESPARLVVDLPDTVNAVDQRRFSLSGSVATDAMLLSNSDKTRLVFNLTEQSTYEMLTRGNTVSLVIATEGTRTSNAVPTSAAYLPQQAAASSDALSGFDFRRGSEGEANILIDLGNSNASVDVDTVGSDMVITIPNYSVPDHLQSRMDVLDFGTPVSYVIIDQVGDDAQITIETQDVFDFSAYQADDQLVLSVAPLTEQQVAERDAMTFEGEKLSFNFQNIEIRSMLQIIADVAELNLVASDTVQGEITLRLVNVPWDQALDIVLRTKGLDKRLVGNVLMVAPAAEIADRERIELENTQKMQDLAPVYTEHFRVNYADAEEINTLFQAMSDDTTSGLLSGRGSAIVDQRTNSIIMTDTQAKLDEFRDLLEKLDIPVRQVSIEARIVLANAGVSRDIGVRWGYDYRNGAGNGGTGISTGSIDGIVDIVNGDPISYGDAPGGLVVDLAASPSSASSFAVGLLTGDNNFLTLELSALEAEGRGEVISQPRV
ncbi:MAG: secretin and TonB N-terminal domain-containing protein, partial [Gammaproteobacteria bacterium]|nr:secretin and TonB N-terminal domain-containing protein [Gammaproteobacteria bacterium]